SCAPRSPPRAQGVDAPMTEPKDISDDEVQDLIETTSRRGRVPYDGETNARPTHLISDQQLDDVMIMLSDHDIEAVAERKRAAEAARRGFEPEKTDNRSNDPVRVYLRKMG